MQKRIKKSHKEYMQELWRDYRHRIAKDKPANIEDAASWAVRNGKWSPRPRSAVKQCAKEMAAAIREETFEDERTGRRVRRYHVAPDPNTKPGEKQLYLWDAIDKASPDHMRRAAQYRRNAIVADFRQLKNDVDWYNENNSHGVELPISYDVTPDMIESEMPTDYEDLDGDEESPDGDGSQQ